MIYYDESYDDFEDDCFYDDDVDGYCFTCNNLGTIPCECGGDLCVCMNNGEMPCPDCDL